VLNPEVNLRRALDRSALLEPAAIRHAAEALEDTVRLHRRSLHRHPELGFEVYATAAYIESVLDRLGIPHRRVAGTGIVAAIEGAGPRCIGIRADMDALPVPEAPGRDGYRSEIPGRSHACGHDGHVAVLLGVAELLVTAGELPGTVSLYFQPAEEGPGGAAPMVAAGAIDDPAVEAVMALHVTNTLPAGVVGLRAGPSTGSDDSFRIVVHGSGGHAAHPDAAVDPIPIAAGIVAALQQVVTREIDPVQPVVLTFGTIAGGTRHNVIATSVELCGTFRTLHAHNRELLRRRIPEVVRALAAAHRAAADVVIEHGYSPGANDPWLTELITESARAVLGREQVVHRPDPSLGGEDFYEFGATGLPVSMFLLGIANPTIGIGAPTHSPNFDIDEAGLPAGVAVFVEAARRFLTA
jgi:amidohydrolase